GQTEFRFERSVNGGPFGRAYWLDSHGQAVKVDDETVEPDTAYAYRFQARISDAIVSEFSDPASKTVPRQFPIPPGALVFPDNFPGMSIAQAMESAKSQGKSEMYLQPSDYTPSGPFGFPGDFALIGGGSGTTTIRSGIVMGLNGGGHMRLAGVRLLNPSAHQIGLELYQVGGGVTLEDVAVEGFPTGVKVDRTSLEADGFECKGATSRSLYITNNGYASVHIKNGYIHNNPGNGIEASWTNADLLIEDTIITQNDGRGAEIVASQGTYEFNRCVFSHNGSHGFVTVGPTVRIRNCVAYSNSGAGFYISGSGDCRNSIAFSNGAEGITGGPWYCVAFGNTGGDIYPDEYRYQVGNNIISDPRFVSAASGDFHLLPDSPAIDSGDPADAYDQEPEPNGNRINMGNYGNTPGATTSLGTPPAVPRDVAVEALPGCSIRVCWWDASDNELGFRVERKREGDSEFLPVYDVQSDNPLSSGTIEMMDEDLMPQTLYWYRVSASNSHGISTSDAVSTVTLAAPVGNRAPNSPINVYPFFAQDGVPPTTILVGSAFSDLDSGDVQAKGRFQVASNGGDFESPVWDSGDVTAGKTYAVIPSSAGLEGNQYYRWRCRYQDDKGAWSAWSNETVFRTELTQPTASSWIFY
ncbi:MAG: right-handed parallel beta-helix repeat-containing protein, partial [bacterium]